MKLHSSSILFLSLAISGRCVSGKDAEKTTTAPAPCTATSASDAFYDLRPDIAVAVKEGDKPPSKWTKTSDYIAKGYDYKANFTLNICAPVVKHVEDAVGIRDKMMKNISAYYESHGKIYSLGQDSTVLTSRGRELALIYTNGSPCPDLEDLDKRSEAQRFRHTVRDEKSSVEARREKEKEARRKSATFAFLCDRDALATEATISFVGTPDECAYFFKVRSQHACAGVEPHKPGSVGPGGVFVIIFLVTVLVYFIGGVFYQRTVAHARGWRQLPNYSLWAGIWGVISDFLIIITSSCARFIPNRRGYHTLSSSPNGRGRNREDENRLIDQLDEEWDD